MRKYGAKFKDLIRSTNTNSDHYDKIYMKIKFNSDDDSSLKNIKNVWHKNSC